MVAAAAARGTRPSNRPHRRSSLFSGLMFLLVFAFLYTNVMEKQTFRGEHPTSFDYRHTRIADVDKNLQHMQQQATTQSPLIDTASIKVTSSFPPLCSKYQIQLIQQQLNSAQTLKVQTNCPDPTWLDEFLPLPGHHAQTEINIKKETIALVVGCNKGYDAVEWLRRLSQNEKFDKARWKQALEYVHFHQHDDIFKKNTSNPNFATNVKRQGLIGGVCGQDISPQPAISHNDVPDTPTNSVHVHCIEAMPNNFKILNKAVHRLGWQDQLHVHHLAMSDTDGGTVPFPDAPRAGKEDVGLGDCMAELGRSHWSKKCVNVTQATIDGFVQRLGLERSNVNYILVDAEGHDWPILLGGQQALTHSLLANGVRYLEFEHHHQGAWKKQYDLSTVVDQLYHNTYTDSYAASHSQSTQSGGATGNMVCYWAGRNGQLWRITNCAHDTTQHKVWSNVVCVSLRNAPEQWIQTMEARFLQTIAEFELEQRHPQAGT